MKQWQTGQEGNYSIEDILSEIQTAEKEGQNVLGIPWFLRLKPVSVDDLISKLQKMKEEEIERLGEFHISLHQQLSIFRESKIIEGFNAPKFDILVTQSGKTMALKFFGEHKENHDMYYLISWISEYDPDKDGPPCAGKMIYLFDIKEGEKIREIIPKSE